MFIRHSQYCSYCWCGWQQALVALVVRLHWSGCASLSIVDSSCAGSYLIFCAEVVMMVVGGGDDGVGEVALVVPVGFGHSVVVGSLVH